MNVIQCCSFCLLYDYKRNYAGEVMGSQRRLDRHLQLVHHRQLAASHGMFQLMFG